MLWAGEQGAWHFTGVKGDIAKEIRENFKALSGGFGSVPVMVKLGKTEWKTSIFWDSRSRGYLLPLKAKVRKAEDILAGDEVTFSIKILI